MDALTTEQLLRDVQNAAAAAPLVKHIEQRLFDLDILEVRVHLQDGMFINVFYNLDTNKTAFALVRNQERIFGADNAKTGWHRHPFDNPNKHDPCEPLTFEQFLAQVEAQFNENK